MLSKNTLGNGVGVCSHHPKAELSGRGRQSAKEHSTFSPVSWRPLSLLLSPPHRSQRRLQRQVSSSNPGKAQGHHCSASTVSHSGTAQLWQTARRREKPAKPWDHLLSYRHGMAKGHCKPSHRLTKGTSHSLS